jgi:hypothetical protein
VNIVVKVIGPKAILHVNIVLDGNKSLLPQAFLSLEKTYFLGELPFNVLGFINKDILH